jgi:ABC-type proline/glycine betaine transport system substrate-binding protein
MAYMNQEKKAIIANVLKPILKKYNIKATMSVRDHSTFVLTLKVV